ncbi:MAG: NADH-quinone oxidoreductase subunit M [Thaumarchaeota archaeon]|nr:MAG: NADH-quinone oxidoreductase subunit M [Nitrososphaerota archaeon]
MPLESGEEGPDGHHGAVHPHLFNRSCSAADPLRVRDGGVQITVSFVLSLLILVPLVGAPVSYLAIRVNKRFGILLTLAIAAAAFAIASYSYWFLYANLPPPGQYALSEKYIWINLSFISLDYLLGLDGLSAPLLVVSTLLALLAIIGSRSQIGHHEAEYYALILLFEGSIVGVFTSLNLIFFYIFWELVLIPMFFLIGIWGGPRRKYAALKFILFTYGGSTIMLLGFLAVYLGTSVPTFDIPDLAGKIPPGLQYLPLLATFIGFGVKLPIVPFHTWLPDAHVEAPAPVSVLLAGVLLKMGGYGFIRISLGLFPQASMQYAWAFMLVGVVTMFYGAIVATLAKDLKRMIALTSINHMGFVLLGAFSTASSGSPLGVQGAIFQMFNHALAIGSLFMLSGYIHEQAGTREIPLLKGLRISMPRTATLLMLSSLAAMGFPIYSSFVSEFMVIAASISAFSPYAVTVLVPALTGAYFMWMLRRTVLSAPTGSVVVKDSPRLDSAVLFAYLVPLFILLIFPYINLDPGKKREALDIRLCFGRRSSIRLGDCRLQQRRATARPSLQEPSHL